MTIEARWIVSTSAGGLHAAAAVLAGAKPVDGKLGPPLADEISGLAGDLAAVGVAPEAFFEHAIPLSVRFDAPLQLAEVALTKTSGRRQSDVAAARLARRLASLAAAFDHAHPGGLEELELRTAPLREQWEARGPGLMAAVRRLTEADVVVDEADVILVQPVLGGGGQAHPSYNSLHIEAVLANPIDSLPEVARLAWLWAQLSLDLPKYQDPLSREALGLVGPLAVLPPVLAGAQEVELMRFERGTLETALSAWNVRSADPETLSQWWETYQATSPTWDVALAALERMLSSQ